MHCINCNFSFAIGDILFIKLFLIDYNTISCTIVSDYDLQFK